MRGRPRSIAIAALALVCATAMSIAYADDFSARLDALWDYHDPVSSEQRFRAELARYSSGSGEALEIKTQIARTQSLRREFTAAHRTLDEIAPALPSADARVHVRYLLERGRTYNSSGSPSRAMPLFEEAAARSEKAGRESDVFYTIDALHMLGIAAPAPEQLDWNLKALAAADAAAGARARGWRGSLLHNIGWTYHNRGDDDTALDYWQKALAVREATGTPSQIRVAKWTVARGLRALGRLDEAEAIQRALANDVETTGAGDGYIYEELAEIALARNDAAAAKPWAAKAYALLKDDGGLKADEPARLARLAKVGGVSP